MTTIGCCRRPSIGARSTPGESRGLEPRGLFQDELTRTEPINFLIIQADVLHEVIVKEGRLGP